MYSAADHLDLIGPSGHLPATLRLQARTGEQYCPLVPKQAGLFGPGVPLDGPLQSDLLLDFASTMHSADFIISFHLILFYAGSSIPIMIVPGS